MASPNTKTNKDTENNHLYNTPIEALEAAWAEGIFERFDVYYDPCNGLGKISDFLKSKGKNVHTSDLVDYGNADFVQDFLKVVRAPRGTQCIVHNPPFKLTEEFVDHSLILCDDLIMFNRATVMETNSRSRKHKDGIWPLKEFYSFGNRVSCTEGVEEKKTANAVWYSWYVYDRYYNGKPTVDWLFTK